MSGDPVLIDTGTRVTPSRLKSCTGVGGAKVWDETCALLSERITVAVQVPFCSDRETMRAGTAIGPARSYASNVISTRSVATATRTCSGLLAFNACLSAVDQPEISLRS